MAARKGKKRIETEKAKKQNVWAVICLALALFLAFSIYFDMTAVVGQWLKALSKGMFGVSAYLIPIFFGYIGVDLIRPRSRSPYFKIAAGVGILLVLSMGQYLFCDEMYVETFNFVSFWNGGNALACGGVLGGLIAFPLIFCISRWGLGLLLVAALICAIIGITDRTLYDFYKAIRRFIQKCMPPERVEAEVMEEESEEEPIRETVHSRRKKMHIDVPVDAYPVEKISDEDATPMLEEAGKLDVKQNSAGGMFPVFAFDDVNPNAYVDPADLSVADKSAEQAAEPIQGEPIEVASTPVQPDSEVFQIPEPTVGEQMPIYEYPPLSLLQRAKKTGGTSQSEVEYTTKKLLSTLHDFGVEATMLGVSAGPNVTRYELQPHAGVKVSKITSLSDDIALSLAATQIRIEAPIPGKAAVGIEIPNQSSGTVFIRELLECEDFANAKSSLTVALGKDISGKNIYADLSKMPHLLIAGATGSGKSVCINSILMSLLYKASPEEVKLIMIDPKVVELGVYNSIPHLFVPVVTNPKKAAGALQWACSEMDRRYNLFQSANVREINSYNEYVETHTENEELQTLPKIVVVIDELADLMMVAAKEVEDHICRLCQKARAAGIFLIIATQRPSVDVVTGLIKANVPSRIAFAVSSGVDSRVIMDAVGAEKLLGRGDMLYRPIGANKPHRIQGCFVSDEEVEKVVAFIKKNAGEASYDESAIQRIDEMASGGKGGGTQESGGESDEDEMLMPAIACVVEAGMASTSFLQRRLKLGYSRAARLIDLMEEKGIVGPFEGSKPRAVKMTMAEFQEMKLGRGDVEETE